MSKKSWLPKKVASFFLTKQSVYQISVHQFFYKAAYFNTSCFTKHCVRATFYTIFFDFHPE